LRPKRILQNKNNPFLSPILPDLSVLQNPLESIPGIRISLRIYHAPGAHGLPVRRPLPGKERSPDPWSFSLSRPTISYQGKTSSGLYVFLIYCKHAEFQKSLSSYMFFIFLAVRTRPSISRGNCSSCHLRSASSGLPAFFTAFRAYHAAPNEWSAI